MAIILAGTSMYDFATFGAVNRDTSGNQKYSGVTESIVIDSGYLQINLDSPLTDFWMTFYAYADTSNWGSWQPGLGFYDSAKSTTKPLVNICSRGSGYPVVVYRDDDGNPSNTPVEIGNAGTFQSLARFDVHVVISSSTGRVEVYQNGYRIISYSGSTDPHGGSAIDLIKWYRVNQYLTFVSAIIIATEDTRPLRMVQQLPNDDGAETDWSNTYSSINDQNDATAIISSSADDVSTFKFPNISSDYDAYAVRSVCLSIRGAASGSPSDIDAVARVGSTNYTEDCANAFNGVVAPNFAQFENNPATASAWTISDVNSAEFGVKSVA